VLRRRPDIECPDSKGIKTSFLAGPTVRVLILNALIQKGLRRCGQCELASIRPDIECPDSKGIKTDLGGIAQGNPDIECPDSKGIKTVGVS